ncbi:hypothetical protein ABZ915_46590 [Streptomyces sp. NPDC046915]|uniref:hypothetical protein n=1 Tax=Streptomyces sp. NPDC046915 TaxID=3155257 RepID=UPI0033F4B1CC
MNTATVPEPRTAATLAARRRKIEAALERVHQAIARLRHEKAQVSAAAIARRADVPGTADAACPVTGAAVDAELGG